MIETKLGETKITKANYKLCNLLNCSKEDVDIAVLSELTADLCAILHYQRNTWHRYRTGYVVQGS